VLSAGVEPGEAIPALVRESLAADDIAVPARRPRALDAIVRDAFDIVVSFTDDAREHASRIHAETHVNWSVPLEDESYIGYRRLIVCLERRIALLAAVADRLCAAEETF